jgi:hypothetical protein
MYSLKKDPTNYLVTKDHVMMIPMADHQKSKTLITV